MFTQNEIKLAKTGDEATIERIIKTYLENFYFIKQNFFFIGGETDDVIQEGMIGLLKAIYKYDFTKNISFDHFAKICIKRQILTKITYYNTKKYKFLTTATDGSYYLENEYTQTVNLNPEIILLSKEKEIFLDNFAKQNLSDFENEIFLFLKKGYLYKEIANKINRKEKSVDNAIQRIKKKFLLNKVKFLLCLK